MARPLDATLIALVVVLVIAAALLACVPQRAVVTAEAPTQIPARLETPRFSVSVTGQGPDVVLIPGLGSAPAVWDATVEQLSQTHRVHVLHVAGFAGEPARGNADGAVVAGVVEDLAGYITRQGLNRPAVIGHSMGGFAGLMLAVRHPEAVGRLMVVDAMPFFSVLITPMATEMLMRPQAEAAAGRMLMQSPEEFETAQARAQANLVTAPEDQARATSWAVTSDRQVMARAMAEVMTTDLRGDIAQIRVPVTVVAAYDPATMPFPRAAVEATWRFNYAPLAGVTVQIVDPARHYVMLDQPAVFAAAVRDFLAD